MKPVFAFFGAFMFLFISCKKENDSVKVGLGETYYIQDGKERNSQTRVVVAAPSGEGLDFVSDYYDEYNTLTANFYIFKIPRKKGKHIIKLTTPHDNDGLTGANYYTLTNEGDVLEEVYIVDESANDNYIEILSINEDKKEITGRFNITVKIDPVEGKQNPASPDAITIEQGEFNLVIE